MSKTFSIISKSFSSKNSICGKESVVRARTETKKPGSDPDPDPGPAKYHSKQAGKWLHMRQQREIRKLWNNLVRKVAKNAKLSTKMIKSPTVGENIALKVILKKKCEI
uniref:Uncharacterized protein n=1 Tax=Romanomermis culicivorax TaxID=13658 RepID=A0A915KN56_ROMCU